MTEQTQRIEAQVAAAALGAELMQPMPPGWYRTECELPDRTWESVACHYTNTNRPWPERADYEVKCEGETRLEAHRLCREQAWAKHRKNTNA